MEAWLCPPESAPHHEFFHPAPPRDELAGTTHHERSAGRGEHLRQPGISGGQSSCLPERHECHSVPHADDRYGLHSGVGVACVCGCAGYVRRGRRGHSALATLDAGNACLMFWSIYAFYRYVKSPTAWRLIATRSEEHTSEL